MISPDEAREEDYRRRHGGMSRAEEKARDAESEEGEIVAHLIAEHEAWVEYMRTSVANSEAFLRWATVRGLDETTLATATRNVAASRQNLKDAEQGLALARGEEP